MREHDIVLLRRKLKISQTALSNAFGLAGGNVVSRWEIGQRVPNEAVRRFCCYLMELSEREALAVLSRLESYGKRKAAR